ncbi:hypothetical protein ABIF38_005244 [Bradyrhizobium japonicum]|nr:hypothetical protein [Bradyrhizobium elkanii]MCS3567782.1 hypothetical protein [Bradyrhizobium elkanii]MCS3590735.1 hypothetical protein [Bradyrhizobium elkanii]MCS3620178.1 hypothetical protein [Bradyrhizobium elkanii]
MLFVAESSDEGRALFVEKQRVRLTIAIIRGR